MGKRRLYKLELGITLAETLSVLSIIGILTALSMKTYQIFLFQAYAAQTKESAMGARLSMEMATSDLELANDNTRYWFIQQGPGKPNPPNDSIFRELYLKSDYLYYLDAYIACNVPTCFKNIIVVLNCKTHYAYIWTRSGDGIEASWYNYYNPAALVGVNCT